MKRILLIDDNAAVRSAVRSMLAYADLELVEVESGLGGIQALETGEFDLAIVDIFMPHMDGLETIQALKKRAPGLRILAMSGSRSHHRFADSPDFLAMAVKLGAAHSLHKPFTAQELGRAIEVCLAGSRADHDRSRAEAVSARRARTATAGRR
jgi:CheY-like chemotaxis protein